MKTIIIFCGMMLFFSAVNGQHKYTYTPNTSNESNNTKTYQFNGANSQNNNAVPRSSNVETTQKNKFSNLPVANSNVARQTNASKYGLKIADIRNSVLGQKLKQQYSSSFTDITNNISFGGNQPKLTTEVLKNPPYRGNISVTPAVSNTSTSSTGGLDCATSQVSLSAYSTNFMIADYAHVGSYIYPGSIYDATDFFGGNYNRDFTNNRYPIILSIDNPAMTHNSIIVQHPAMQTIRNAISNLYNNMPNNSPVSEGTEYQVFSANNSAEQTMKISGGGSGYGVTINVSNTNSQMDSTLNITIDARKTLFTINAIPSENGFFSASPGPNSNNLIMINQVEYGIRILANVTLTFHSQQELSDFNGKYSNFGITANADLNDLSKYHSTTATINYYQVGGPANGKTGILAFTPDQLQNEVIQILNSVTYSSARPIGYNLCDLALDEIGTKSATDQFPQTLCTPNGDLQTVFVNVGTGSDGKDNNTFYSYTLYDANNNEIASFSDPTQNSLINEYSSKTDQLSVRGTYLPSQFMNSGGGHLHVHIHPNGGLGHDTWVIQQLTLELNFSGQPQSITWGRPAIGTDDNDKTQNNQIAAVVMSQDNKDVDLYFNSTFAKQ